MPTQSQPTWNDLQNAYQSAAAQYRAQNGEDPSGVFGFNVPGFGYVNVNHDNNGETQFMHSVPGANGDPGTGYFLKNDNGNIGTAGSYQLGNDGFLSGALPILGVLAPALLGALAPALAGAGGEAANLAAADAAGGLAPEFGSNAAYDAFMNAAAATPGYDAAMQSVIDGMGDSVGSDWASGLQSAMNPGNLGTYSPTDPWSYDSVGSDWSQGLPDAQNPGMGSDFFQSGAVDNPGSDWSSGDPGAMNPGNQGTYTPIDPATGQPYYDNPGSDWAHGDPAAQNPGNTGQFTPVDPAVSTPSGTGPAAAASGAGSLLPKLITALLGAGAAVTGNRQAVGVGTSAKIDKPTDYTPKILGTTPSVNNAQALGQALLLRDYEQPHFSSVGYQPISDMSQFAKSLRGGG